MAFRQNYGATHIHLINCSAEMGLPPPLYVTGLCHGVAIMGMYAALAYDLELFNERFAQISRLPPSLFKMYVERAEEEQLQIYNTIKEQSIREFKPEEGNKLANTALLQKLINENFLKKLASLPFGKRAALSIPAFMAVINLAQP